mmetsp:Transcript_2413/g.6109  ORF Transcript_2413/g.6109 Transcript_2413/m.6109 type:complete len:276 (-) Transcript_2413:72-899(-)
MPFFEVDARLASACNTWLTAEEVTFLENAAALKLDRSQVDRAWLWGKVTGAEDDYLVVAAQKKLQEEQDYPVVEFYYTTAGRFALKPLPSSALPAAVKRNTPLTGNPTTELLAATEAEDADEESKEDAPLGSPAFLEADLLGVIVREVHQATSVVPKGAFLADPTHRVVRNRNFSGLSAAVASATSGYCHFREPADPMKARDADGLLRPKDFLDPIDTTHPPGAWSVQLDPCEQRAVIRSLMYPGYTFYHDVCTSNFGGVYVGDGSKNDDIAFML